MDKLVDINGLQLYHNNIKDKLLPDYDKSNQLLVYDNTPIWKDISDIANIEDILSYGVSWSVGLKDPHLTRIGNMTMHKTLPILSQMKGCVYNTLEKKVVYWLDGNNWWFKPESTFIGLFLNNLNPLWALDKGDNGETWLNLGTSSEIVNSIVGKRWHLQALGKDIIVDTSFKEDDNNVIVLTVVSGDISIVKSATVVVLVRYGEGSRLDGYDGEVRIYIPEFYIKSHDGRIDNTDNWVRISTFKIDDTWEYLPASFMSAYRITILNEVPENMGYLSTLPINSAVSIVNTATYCRGGKNNSNWDIYLKGLEDTTNPYTKDPLRTLLGKPRNALTRSYARKAARNSGAELLSYTLYKNILCWLYIIEYANFNSQETYNSNLTSEGFYLGGIGPGLTVTSEYMYTYVQNTGEVTPCGYGNTLGNKTGCKSMEIPNSFDVHIGEINHLNNASISNEVGTHLDGKIVITNIVSSTNSTINIGYQYTSKKVTYKVTGLTTAGETIIFKTDQIQLGTLSEDGTITIDWPANTLSRKIYFSEVKSDVNITIEIVSAVPGVIYQTGLGLTLLVPRWRGFDNPFGDSNIALDGVIVKGNGDDGFTAYITSDPNKYGDTEESASQMETIVKSPIVHAGNISSLNLGTVAHIIPDGLLQDTDWGYSTYICDRITYSKNSGNYLLQLSVGGDKHYGGGYGLLFSNITQHINSDPMINYSFVTICTP